LVALRDNVHHSPARPLRSNGNVTHPLDGDYDDLPALEPVESGPSSSSPLSLRETPSPAPVPSIPSLSQPLSATTAATSRFSTVVGNRSQEQVFIDLVSEDESDEDDEGAPCEVVEQAFVGESSGMRSEDVEREVAGRFGEDREMIWLDNDVVPDNSQATAAYTVGRRAGQLTTDINDPAELSLVENVPDQPEHDVEPPFVTDGRGRVVWSSMRPGRAVQAEAVHESPTPSHLIYTGTTGITTRIKRRAGRESNSVVGTTTSSGFTTDGRGRVIGTGSPDTVAGGHGNEELAASGVDAESDMVQVAEPSQNGPRRSFFGRMYDVVFS
jgi:E3 ubiquitin-protein ligase makorin